MENNTSLQQQLLDAGVHFGHLKKKWNPKMLPYIFAEKKGIHIIDLNKTVDHLQEAAAAVAALAGCADAFAVPTGLPTAWNAAGRRSRCDRNRCA